MLRGTKFLDFCEMQTCMVYSSFRKQKIAEKATDYNEA